MVEPTNSKNMSQIGSFPQVEVNIKNACVATTQWWTCLSETTKSQLAWMNHLFEHPCKKSNLAEQQQRSSWFWYYLLTIDLCILDRTKKHWPLRTNSFDGVIFSPHLDGVINGFSWGEITRHCWGYITLVGRGPHFAPYMYQIKQSPVVLRRPSLSLRRFQPWLRSTRFPGAQVWRGERF